MRATMHNGLVRKDGKAYSAKHNDRNCPRGENIIDNPKQRNRYFIVDENGTVTNKPQTTFDEHEQQMYEKLFSVSLTAQNDRYIKKRNYDRVKTMEEYRKNPRSCPEEILLYIGKKGQEVDPKALMRACNKWLLAMQKYANIQILDGAIHFDEEGQPHCHIRWVWLAHGKDGLEVSQTKALEEMGIERPDMSKPQTKYNNAKMTFTERARQIWVDVIQQEGYSVETVPEQPGKRTMTKEEYIANKYREEMLKAYRETEKLNREKKQLQTEVALLQQEKKELRKKLTRLTEAVTNILDEINREFGLDTSPILNEAIDEYNKAYDDLYFDEKE